MILGPGDPRHGTINGYSNHDCRCEDCRAALRAYTAKYRASNAKKVIAASAKSRAGNQWVEDVDRDVLWERDGGICHICGLAADPNRWDPDHIRPVRYGGEHSYANTAVSHPLCNMRKGSRLGAPTDGAGAPWENQAPIWEQCQGDCGREYLYPHLCREHRLCCECHIGTT